MQKNLYSQKLQPKAVLVSVITQSINSTESENYLRELAFLAQTLGIQTIRTFTQQLPKIHPKTFVGKGKLNAVLEFVKREKIAIIIFDDDLTTAQIRNLEALFKEVSILDRSLVILQIFAKHARTAQAKTQVELAQYEYMLPRLTHLWTHHSRQKGGIGLRGPGETELETDRRLIKNRISLLKRKLTKIETQNQIRAKNRHAIFRIALVGYTNVGKSTLMNLLTKADVYIDDKLFATLDLTTRRWQIEDKQVLLSDTIGFIRKLPPMLIESFKATLEEVTQADLLLHVVDISDPQFEKQIDFVEDVLLQIGCQNKQTILIFNKIDRYQARVVPPFEPDFKPNSIAAWRESYWAKARACVFISAHKKENIAELRSLIYANID